MNIGLTSSSARSHPSGQGSDAGFTLVEILIVLVIVGLLLAVAYPSYLDSIRKSRRAEAVQAVTAVIQAQERFRANEPTYGNFNSPADAGTLPIAVPRSSPHYDLTITGAAAAGYTVTATGHGSQDKDGNCKLMGVQVANGNLRYGSGASSVDFAASSPDTGRCWAQ